MPTSWITNRVVTGRQEAETERQLRQLAERPYRCSGCGSRYETSADMTMITASASCGEGPQTDSLGYIMGYCRSCYTGSLRCDTCNHVRPYSEQPYRRTLNGARIIQCQPCHEAHIAREGLVPCYSCGDYATEATMELPVYARRDDVDRMLCRQCIGDSGVVAQYNANPLDSLDFIGKSNDKLFYGVELEVEVAEDFDYDEVTRRVYNSVKGFAMLKHDGSLDNGFEVVSAPMTMEAHKSELWDEFFGKGKTGLKAWATKTCGMHVHVSRAPLSPMTIGKVVEFVHSEANAQFIAAVAGRKSNRYCEYSNGHRMTAVLRKYANYRERYNAVNINNENTIEIRIFRGTLNRKKVLKNLEFCQALVKFVAAHSATEAVQHKLFVAWVGMNHKFYPNLHDFLKSQWSVNARYVANYRNAYKIELKSIADDNKALAEAKNELAAARRSLDESVRRQNLRYQEVAPSPLRGERADGGMSETSRRIMEFATAARGAAARHYPDASVIRYDDDLSERVDYSAMNDDLLRASIDALSTSLRNGDMRRRFR